MKIVQSSFNQHQARHRCLFCVLSRNLAIEKSGSHWIYDGKGDRYFNTFILEFK